MSTFGTKQTFCFLLNQPYYADNLQLRLAVLNGIVFRI